MRADEAQLCVEQVRRDQLQPVAVEVLELALRIDRGELDEARIVMRIAQRQRGAVNEVGSEPEIQLVALETLLAGIHQRRHAAGAEGRDHEIVERHLE